MLHASQAQRATNLPDLLILRDLLLTLMERSDVRRLSNGHYRLVLPVTIAQLDDLAALGAASADDEEDDAGEDEPDCEDDDPAEDADADEDDHRFEFGEEQAA